MTLKKRETIIFMHIPKTAGSTMLFILNNKYRFKKTISIGNVNRIDSLTNLPLSEKQNLKVLKGHFHFGIHTHLATNYKYITFFREPIARSISAYNYLYQNKNHYFHKEIIDNKYSLKDMLKGGYIKNFDNCQVRFLAGAKELDYGLVTEETYNTAIHNLNTHIYAFGICEKFDESLMHLKKVLNWSSPFYVKANIANKQKYTNTFDQETIDLLNKYNKYDLKLYNYVYEKFNTKISSYGEKFEKEVSLFQKINNLQYPLRKHIRNIWLKLKK